MRLFIAEKPSLAGHIVAALAAKGVKQGTHYVCGDDIVTWCVGHMYEMAQPEDYGDQFKKWTFDVLPIVPTDWKLHPRAEMKAQIAAIKGLLAKATEVIHAGDPDREGQLLVDELLDELKNKRPVLRLTLPATNVEAVRKALSSMRPNAEFQTTRQSALARQRGDWLVGMNLTRAFSLVGQATGIKGVLSVGRVQTPTLALIVNRDLAIEGFKARDFYGVTADINAAGGAFVAKWKPSDLVVVDESGRVLDKAVAEALALKVTGQVGSVVSFEAVTKKQGAPLPHSLSSLQQAANNKLGLSAAELLSVAQELYDAKLTTYPRSDCRYLPEGQHGDAQGVLSSLPAMYQPLVSQADTKLKSAAFDDSNVTAHFAIIPTGQTANLTGVQAQVFDIIVRGYLSQFYPAHTYQQTSIVLDITGETFTASGKVPLTSGWKAVFGASADDETEDKDKQGDDKQALPALAKNEAVKCNKAAVASKKTSAPARYTEAALLESMNNLKSIVDDPEIKKRLKDKAALGTPATQSGIIETLKKRGFIATKGKQLISLPAGRQLIAALPAQVKSPGITGLFEQALEAIVDGTLTTEQVVAKQLAYVTKYVEVARQTKFAAPPLARPAMVVKKPGGGKASAARAMQMLAASQAAGR